ncbi:biosynthetic peptidoglycan transglycosylase [Geotalea daltonii FRC-32]|uniref:Biosynthetic peptidoglycan transglycosylase n=1 Tax=Geotalea daltonii (strain DSM 22248 / JCM 15807 / FRC-32) TaxID=316067 RepID=B9LZ79_GEODF|nr:biosynthetic peptidoglycan transglycosylase [Geotalea daltonii]ACM18811.1 biosynthetic peptidoglycan transglycosylase [Geotalea daltonii FRC-32]
MKKIFVILAGLAILYAAYIGVSLMLLPSVSDLQKRRASMTIQVRDWHGKYHPFVVGPKNRYWTSGASIPPEMKWAVILAEDANFYKHEGIDVKAIKNAIKYDLEKKTFARGASTITQQVAKNLFLSREKTISRKVKEVVLARRMEQELTKGRIIELYLNLVELGPMVYGIGHGAHYYFGKPASALTPRECAIFAAMLPGPRVAYNPYRNMGKVLKRSNMILRLLLNKGVLSQAEYRQALAESPNIGRLQKKVDESIKKEEVLLPNISSAKNEEESKAEPTTDGEGAVNGAQPDMEEDSRQNVPPATEEQAQPEADTQAEQK